MDTFLRISHWLANVKRVLGPGRRAVVWVQGCSRGCPECIAPEMRSCDGGHWVAVTELAREILQTAPEGITVTGGEPAEQAEAVTALLDALRPGGENVIVYTGWLLEQLQMNEVPGGAALAARADILIDGAYVAALDAGGAMAGSENQRIHRLTATGRSLELADKREWELMVDAGGGVTLTGIPPRGFAGRLQRRLAAQGLTLPEWS